MENTNEGEMTEKENEVVLEKRVDSCETVVVDDMPEEVEKGMTRLNPPATESTEEAGSVLGCDEEKQTECSDDVKESEVVQTSDQVDSSVSAVQEEVPSTGGEEGSSVQPDVSLEQSKEIESVVPVNGGDEVVSASGPDEVEIQEEKPVVVEEKCESVQEEEHVQEEEISVPEEKCESVQEEESVPEVVQADEKPVSVEEMKADSVSEEVATAPVVEEEKPASIQEEHESVHEEVLPVDNPAPVHEEPQPAQTLASVQETTVPQPVKEETVSVHEENLQPTQEENPQPTHEENLPEEKSQPTHEENLPEEKSQHTHEENLPEEKPQPTHENPQHTKPSVLPQEEEKPAIPEDLPAEKPLNATDSPLRPERNSNPPQHSRFLVARPPRTIRMNLRDIPSPSHTPGASALPVTPFSLNTSRDTTRLSTSNVVVKLREKKEDATEEGVPKWQEGRVTMLVLNMVDKTGNNVSVQRGSDV